MNREALIARKHAVQQELKQAQRQLATAQTLWEQQTENKKKPSPIKTADHLERRWLSSLWYWIVKGARGPRAHQARIAQLQQRVDSLMAEEYRLRRAIDQSQR